MGLVFESIDQLLHDELAEYQKLKRASKETISDLIRKASQKLYDSKMCETNQIARVLKKKFIDHKSLVEKTLPDSYKLVTRPKEADIPKSELQEVFFLSVKLFDEKSKLCKKIYSALKQDPEFENNLKDQKFRSLDEVKSDMAELEVIKNLVDKREKLHEWQKVIVRKKSLEDTLHHVAEIFDQSAKWIKHINEDQELDKIINEIQQCPKCHWQIADWFNVNAERVRKGLPVKQP